MDRPALSIDIAPKDQKELSKPFDNFATFYVSSSGGYHPGIGCFRPMLSAVGQGAQQMQCCWK
jgi:hypothetical protein